MRQNTLPKDYVASFFFGGIGDARHLYASLVDIKDQQKNQPVCYGQLFIPKTSEFAVLKVLIIFLESAKVPFYSGGYQAPGDS